MAMDAAAVRSWIAGFEAARKAEHDAAAPGDRSRLVAIALQLSSAALAARAPAMRERREAEDGRVRETWCRLKRRPR